MSKENNYAEFNGIGFWVRETDISVSFKNSTHKFNQADDLIKNHGKEPTGYSFTAIFIGNDYQQKSNQLTAEINKQNTGILSHPKLGQIEIIIDNYSTQISTIKNQALIKISCRNNNKTKVATTTNHADKFNDDKAQLINNITTDAQSQIQKLQPTEQILQLKAFGNGATIQNLQQYIPNTPTKTGDTIAAVVGKKIKTLNTLASAINNKYSSSDDFIDAMQHIYIALHQPEITNSQQANDFYGLQHSFAEVVIANNSHLPKVKTTAANTELPSDVLQQQHAGLLSDSIHPLFSDKEISYVS
jgi:prophage DNA circulation protein